MTNYLPYIFGVSFLSLGIYFFLISFRLYKPKYKTEEQKERVEKSLRKYGILLKICSVILILNGGYDVIVHNVDRYRIEPDGTEWTKEDKQVLTKNCVREAGETATKYPQYTKDYCECTTEKITKSMTKKQYNSIVVKPQSEQLKEFTPIIQDCLTELKRQIHGADAVTKR